MTDANPEVSKNAAMVRFERVFADPTPALRAIGAIMVAESQDAFKAQKFGEEEWKPRSVPNVMGLIADFALGRREPLARRFESRPALLDTGRLKQSIAFRVVSNEAVEIGSNLEYAATMQFGGEVESEPVTSEMQEAIWRWLKTDSGKPYKKNVGFLLNKNQTNKTVQSSVPPRTFVGISDQTIADITEMLGALIQGKAIYEGTDDG